MPYNNITLNLFTLGIKRNVFAIFIDTLRLKQNLLKDHIFDLLMKLKKCKNVMEQ